MKFKNNLGGQNEAGSQVVILNSAIGYWILHLDIESTKCERLQI